MLRPIILPIIKNTRLCVTAWHIMNPRCYRPETSWVHYTSSCNTQFCVLEDGQNNWPKHVELTGIINKPLLLHLFGCLYYLYQWWTVKQISNNEIYLLIKYIKSVLWRVAKRLSYIEDAWWLMVKVIGAIPPFLHTTSQLTQEKIPFVRPTTSAWLVCDNLFSQTVPNSVF